jgi:hypothetical protein
MEAITIQNGYKTAVVSEWHTDGSILYVVSGRNGGRTRTFKTLKNAIAFAQRYVA